MAGGAGFNNELSCGSFKIVDTTVFQSFPTKNARDLVKNKVQREILTVVAVSKLRL